MKFLVDMPLSPVLAKWLSERGHLASHAAQRGLEKADDATILQVALDEGAVVVTADLDYPRLLALAGSTGPAILLFRGGDWGEEEILRRLEHTLGVISEAEIPNSIVVIEAHPNSQKATPHDLRRSPHAFVTSPNSTRPRHW